MSGLTNHSFNKSVAFIEVPKKVLTEPILLDQLIDRSRLIENYALSDEQRKNIFEVHSWEPVINNIPPPIPIAAPTAPPLPFIYLGKKLEGETWEIYLARGEETLIIKEHSELDSSYRVESIQPPNLIVTYLPLKQTQTINIGAPD